MRNVVFGCLVLALVAASAGRADAQVVGFDELSPTDIPILGAVVCAEGTGFRFQSDHFHLIGPGAQDFSSNGTSHIGYESGRGLPITMERVGGGTFSLLALDAGEFYAVATDRPEAQTILITGVQLDGGMVSHTIAIDGLHDGPGGVADFQHFVLPATFVNLTSVTFAGFRSGGADGGIAIDNLAYQLASPETLAPCVAFPLTSDTPVVTITSPAAGNVSGLVHVQASATDNVGIASVQFRLDGVDLGAPDTTAPYAVVWDTSAVRDGPHTLTAEARDTASNVASASVVVTVRNEPVIVPSPNYLELDGTDDYLQASDANALSFGTGTADAPMSIEAWFRPDAMGRHQLVGKGMDGSLEYRLRVAAGVIRFDLRDASAGAIASAFTSHQGALVGSWHHLAVTYDGRGGPTAANGITIHVDGVSLPLTRLNNASYVAMENLTGTLQIGREGPSTNHYDGGLDEIRIWNVARSNADIQSTMMTELQGAEPGLVGYWRFNDGSGGSARDDSPSNNPATLVNGPLWVPGGPMAPPAPDVTAPEISSVATSNLTHAGITISFATNEVATGWVSYTVSGACPCTDVFSSGPTATHVVTLTGLAADTGYHFFVNARDGSNNASATPAIAFRTPAIPPDTTAPAVSFVRPASSTVASIVAVEAAASDNVGIASVQFQVDGSNLGPPDGSAPYTAVWDTTTLADGPHTLTAEARDLANNVATVSVTVNVRNNVVVTPHYLDLDGVNDYLQAADANDLSFGTGTADAPLTIETWFRPDAMGRHQLVSKGMDGSLEYRLRIAAGVIRFDLRDASAGAIASAFTSHQGALVGAWHHLAVTYDGRGGATAANGIAIYIDGVAAGLTRLNNAAYVAMENLAGTLQIGREGPSTNHYDGGLDELRIWNVARSAADIQAASAVELGGSEPGLVAYWKFNEGLDAIADDTSPADHPATLVNGPLWLSGGPLAPPQPDVNAPEIGSIATSNLTHSGITVSFTTSEVATVWVSYTAAAACPCTDVFGASSATTHAVRLAALAPDTTYRFFIHAIDAASNERVSAAMTFTTPVVPPDTTAPSISFLRPAAGNVASTVTVEAAATDDVGIASVRFQLDGVNLGPVDDAAPYSVLWDTTGVADGPHTLTAEARDLSNNVATVSLSVNVRNNVVVTPHYLEFDGVNDYLQAPDANDLSFGTGAGDTPLTIETWLRPDAMGRHQLVGKGMDGSLEYRLRVAAGVIRFDLRDASANAIASAFTSPQSALIGAWHHLAVTYDGRGGAAAANGISIYIDGVAVALTRLNNTAYVAMENLAGTLQVGREGPSTNHYDGGLDELRIWNVARSAADIQSSMMTGLAGVEPGLVGYWRFDEGTDAAAADSSPAGHTATLVNNPAWAAGGPLP